MSAFQIDIHNLNHTAYMLRRYMAEVRPQSFASLYPLFEKLRKKAEDTYSYAYDAPDIEEYAERESIRRFGFC